MKVLFVEPPQGDKNPEGEYARRYLRQAKKNLNIKTVTSIPEMVRKIVEDEEKTIRVIILISTEKAFVTEALDMITSLRKFIVISNAVDVLTKAEIRKYAKKSMLHLDYVIDPDDIIAFCTKAQIHLIEPSGTKSRDGFKKFTFWVDTTDSNIVEYYFETLKQNIERINKAYGMKLQAKRYGANKIILRSNDEYSNWMISVAEKFEELFKD